MYDIEINKSIIRIEKIFHLFGLWRTDDESFGFCKTAWKLLYLIYFFSYLLSLALGGLITDDWNQSIYLISASIASLLMTVKMAYILWKKKEILQFIQDIGTHSVVHYEEFVKVNDKVKKLMHFSSSLYLIICVTNGALIAFRLPIFSREKSLPFDIWFPFDWKDNTIIHWIAYIYVLIAMTLGVVTSSFNIIIWYLMLNCAVKYQILGNHFRNVLFTKPSNGKTRISKEDNSCLHEFIGLINHHQNIQEFAALMCLIWKNNNFLFITRTVDRFKSFFETIFFTQITTSGICICGLVYALAFSCRGESLSQILVQCTVLLYSLFDIFMVMYLGNEIKLWRDRLSYSLFASDWLQQSKSSKDFIIIVIEVLKQPRELVIGKLYPVNMTTFASIMNLAYSMFNILQNVK